MLDSRKNRLIIFTTYCTRKHNIVSNKDAEEKTISDRISIRALIESNGMPIGLCSIYIHRFDSVRVYMLMLTKKIKGLNCLLEKNTKKTFE